MNFCILFIFLFEYIHRRRVSQYIPYQYRIIEYNTSTSHFIHICVTVQTLYQIEMCLYVHIWRTLHTFQNLFLCHPKSMIHFTFSSHFLRLLSHPKTNLRKHFLLESVTSSSYCYHSSFRPKMIVKRSEFIIGMTQYFLCT